jgi:hypothetical protein
MTKVHIEIIEALGEEFDRAARLSGASALEVLVAAVTYASLAADFVTDQKTREVILNAFVHMRDEQQGLQ